MSKNNFSNIYTVINAFSSITLGVLAYCFIVAPLIKESTYQEVASSTFIHIGLEYLLVAVIISVVWIGILLLRR